MKKLLLSILLAVAGLASVQAQNAYPLFEPATGVLKGDTNTYVTTAAASADIINLWTACSVTTFLKGNGACSLIDLTANVTGTLPAGNGGTGQTSLGNMTDVDDTNVTLTLGGTPTGSLIRSTSLTLGWAGTLAAARGGLGFGTVVDDTIPIANGTIWQPKAVPVCTDTAGNHLNYDTATNTISCGTSSSVSAVTPANPTGLIGMSAVNGVSANYTRSDGHSAIDPAIAPTWTAQHIYTSTAGSGAARFSSINPSTVWTETDSAADTGNWRARVNGDAFTLAAVNDAFSTQSDILIATRVAAAVQQIRFGGTSDNPAFQFLGSGTITANGAFSGTRNLVGSAYSLGWTNGDNTNAASDAQIGLLVGGSSGGDPLISFTVLGATTWTAGADNSDADAFKVCPGALGSGCIIRATAAGIDFPVAASVAGSAICRADGTNCPAGVATTVVKAAATDRTSTTTITSDPDLQFTAVSGGTYDIQFCLAFGGVTTGVQGFKFAFNLTSAGTQNGMWGGSSRVNAAGAAHSGLLLGDTTGGVTGLVSYATITVGNGTNQVCGQGVVSQSSAVTYAIQWAQVASNVNATRLNQGSYLRYTRTN